MLDSVIILLDKFLPDELSRQACFSENVFAPQYGSHPYLFALSTVPFEQFVAFFMLGMIPNTILNLLIGEALSEASEPHVSDPFGFWFFWGDVEFRVSVPLFCLHFMWQDFLQILLLPTCQPIPSFLLPDKTATKRSVLPNRELINTI